MDLQTNQNVRKRKKRVFMQIFFRTLVAFVLFLQTKIKNDAVLLFNNTRLFFGLALLLVGLFSFSSGKYCDGNSSNYYSCTRPSTYYYYPWWTIVFITLGSFFVVLWFLRKKSNL
jgi:hypothetical protein